MRDRGNSLMFSACSLFLAGACSIHAQTARPAIPCLLKEVSPQQQELIWAAAPEKPRVPPKKPRRVLISGTHGGHWYVAPRGAHMFQVLGLKSGAYDVVVSSNDASMFLPENLAKFDAVVFNNEGMPSDDEALGKLWEYGDKAQVKRLLRESLLDYLSNGGGVVGMHAALLAYGDDMEYRWMWGAGYDGHPWHEEVGIKLDEPAHPLLAAFGGANFRLHDEIYRFRPPYTREYVRVLLSIDIANTDMEPKSVYFEGRVKRQGDPDDFALAWVLRYGKGRVFYCALGHVNEVYWDPKLAQFFLDGMQFATGDLDAPTLPSAWGGDKFDFESVKARLAKAEGLERTAILRALPSYAGEEAVPLYLEALQDKDPQNRMAALRALGSYGSAEALPMLAEAASSAQEPDVKEAARTALARMRGAGVEPAMIACAADADELTEIRVEMFRALAARKAAAAVPAILAAARDKDGEVRMAALKALAAAADAAAAPALLELVKGAAAAGEREAAAAAFGAAVGRATAAEREKEIERLSAEFDKAGAEARAGLARAAGFAGGDKALALVRRGLKDKEAQVREAAVAALAAWPDAAPFDELLALARDGESAGQRAAALAGYVRMIGMRKELSAEQACEMYRGALDLAERDEEKAAVFTALAAVRHTQALKVLEQAIEEMNLLGEDSALGIAESALLKAAIGVAESHPKEAREALERLAGSTSDKDIAERAAKAVQSIQ